MRGMHWGAPEAGEMFGVPNGAVIFEDTGFPRKGDKPALVGRQYSRTIGKTDNCQVGVFMSYASAHGHTLVDRRLYILSQWFEAVAAVRRKQAAMPSSVTFQTKIQIAMDMLAKVHARGHLLFQCVGGDSAYGDSHVFRRVVDGMGKCYCFHLHSNFPIWTGDPAWKVLDATENRSGLQASQRRNRFGSLQADEIPRLVSSHYPVDPCPCLPESRSTAMGIKIRYRLRSLKSEDSWNWSFKSRFISRRCPRLVPDAAKEQGDIKNLPNKKMAERSSNIRYTTSVVVVNIHYFMVWREIHSLCIGDCV